MIKQTYKTNRIRNPNKYQYIDMYIYIHIYIYTYINNTHIKTFKTNIQKQ